MQVAAFLMPLFVCLQRWGNIGELGPMRCDKLFAYQVIYLIVIFLNEHA